MGKIHKETSHNFLEIVPYVIMDIETIIKEIILSKRCYFYDTCSFRNHMLISNMNLIFEYLSSTFGVVIITRTIIMELCSNDGELWNEHIQYIRNMNKAGIKILLIYEEDLFEVLHTYCFDVVKINKWLSYAVKNAKCKFGSIEQLLNNEPKFKKALFESEECKDSKLAKKLIQQNIKIY